MTGPVGGVIGWPVEHSRSPVVHGYWLRHHGLPGAYRKFAVPPGEVAEFLDRIRTGELTGVNVTVPHKEAAFAAVRRHHPAALATGTVNTVWVEDGELTGTSTDPEGFLANLDAASPGWDARAGKAVLLGAGGAARALAWALSTRGIGEILIVNRTLARAEALIADLGLAATPVAWQDREAALAGAGCVVNATSLGMSGQGMLDVGLANVADNAVVNDIVYTPLETPLLAEARARGFVAIDGLGMLLHQAVFGFEKMFGLRPEVTDDLRRAVLDDMAAG